MKRSVDLIRPYYSLLFLTGYGSSCRVLSDIDIVHSIGSLRKYNKPTIYEVDLSPIEYFYYYLKVPLSKLMHVYKFFNDFFKNQERLLITWQPSNLRIIRKFGFDESKVSYIPPPINIIERTREVDNEEPKILFVGYNFYHKGGDIALKAFSIINKEIPKSKLIFISNYFPKSNFNNVIYFGTVENLTLKRKILPTVDILLSPFRPNFPSGMSLLEAMSAGVPVIATYHPLLESYVLDGFNGFSVKEYNPKAFAEKTIELLQDKNELKSMHRNAIKYINENYFPTIVSNKLVKVYQQLFNN
jgi:glycosyltransferase involved in cell wall biosynthesis